MPRSRLFVTTVATASSIALLTGAGHAGTEVDVTPANLQGFVIAPFPDDPASAPYAFVEDADAPLGAGSLQFTVDPGSPTNKFIMFPPVAGVAAPSLEAIGYDFQPDPGQAVQFYLNVYVDLDATTSPESFYDCRYDFVPAAGGTGAWQSFDVDPSTLPAVVAVRNASTCPATLGGLDADDVVNYLAINGGDTSGTDNGMSGAFDAVRVTLDGATTVYDLEPIVEPGDKDDCKKGGWQDVTRADGTPFTNQGDCIQYVNTGR